MKIVTPQTVTTGTLTATNVTITETLWTAGTYALGVQRYVGTNLYEVIIATTSAEPTVGVAADPPSWRLVGSINRWKMFDDVISSQTTRTGTIAVTITPGQVVNAVAFFNVSANTVNVTVTDPVEGIVYNTTQTLQDNTLIVDWWAYFFEPIFAKQDAVFTNLPSYRNATITATLDAGAGVAACGAMVIGRQATLGLANFGSGVSIQDYSRKETDAFGNIQIEERAFAKRADYDVTIDSNRVATVQQLLAAIRATPTVYIGEDNRPETVVYGFFRQFDIVIATPTISDCSIQVEGLI